MTKKVIAGVLILALLAVCGAAVLAGFVGYQMLADSGARVRLFNADTVSAKATEEKTIEVNGVADLTVENDFGFVTVEAGDVKTIQVSAEKTAWGINQTEAEAALEDIQVVVEQNGDKIRISVKQPAEVDVMSVGPGGGSVDFTITVPAQINLTLVSRAGDVSLRGTTGEASLKTDFGKLEVYDVTGAVQAETTNGEIEAARIKADGAIQLRSEFGSLKVEMLEGETLTLVTTNGEIKAEALQAADEIRLESSFGAISLETGKGKTLTTQTQNGQVTLKALELSGALTVTSQFGDLELDKVSAASYELNTENGKIHVDGAQGKLLAHSNFGGIEILNATDVTLDIKTENGEVSFSGSLGEGPHTVESKFGNITLFLPGSANLNVKLDTQMGVVRSDLPIAMTLQGEVESKTIEGAVNGGGAALIVTTENGNIELKILK